MPASITGRPAHLPFERFKETPLRLDETPVFSRVRVTAVGSLSTSEKDSNLLGAAVITWTSLEPSDDVFAEVDVRGVLTSGSELHWMAGDTEVEMIELPHYAGMPEDLVLQARPIASPAGSKAYSGIAEGWPPLIWNSHTLYRAVKGYDDYDTAVEKILCALSVAPDDGDLRPMLLAGLKASYARLVRSAASYPQPWRTQKGPTEGMLGVLRL
jgi:hypothetical protein